MAQFVSKYPANIDAIKAGDNYFFVVPGQLDTTKVPAAAFEAMMSAQQTNCTASTSSVSSQPSVTNPAAGTTQSPTAGQQAPLS
jgi:hypothetical protein